MKIGMIGAGKVGFSLGKFFAQGGVPVTGYYSRTPESAKEAAAFTDSQYYSDLKKLIEDSDAIFITVPDQAIQTVYQQVRQFDVQDKFLCHCSGALSASDAFPGIEDSGARGVSIHPLFPVSSKYASYRELPDAFFCLEGDETAVSLLRPLLEGLGARVQRIAPSDKVRYHAGCVMASNFVCALSQVSIELLASCGFTPDSARQALAPLMRSNLEHVLENGAVAALTGPVERCDTATVEKHLQCLTAPEEQALYRLLSGKLVEMAKEKHPDMDYSALTALIEEKGNEKR